jgi:hypothetical protein
MMYLCGISVSKNYKNKIDDMKKSLFLFIALTMLLGACQSRQGAETAAENETTVSGQLQATEVENCVKRIYSEVFKPYLVEDSLRKLGKSAEMAPDDHRLNSYSDFCSSGLTDLMRQVNVIDSLHHAGEVGFLDSDYWIMAQDFGSDLAVSDVKTVSINGNEALVQLMLHNLGTTKPVSLQLLNEGGNWKIDNFIDEENGFNLKKAAQEYLEAENQENKK